MRPTVGTFAERRATADRAEMMLNPADVESAAGEIRLGRLETQLVARHEPQQVSVPAADGAIALRHFLAVTFHFVTESFRRDNCLHGSFPDTPDELSKSVLPASV